jgi:RNA polymerase sigma factor for flagellar operon FliA
VASERQDLFLKYRENRSTALRNEIVLEYMDMVTQTAVVMRNMYAKGYEVDDLVNEGVLALIAATESFDLDRGVKFETYAGLKIRGAIIDYIRRQDWIPRRVRKFGRKLDEAYGFLYGELGRTPTNEELAEYLELSEKQFNQMLADSAAINTMSFEELLYEDNISVYNTSGISVNSSDGGVAARLYAEERKRVIAEAIAELKPREQQVVSLYYYEKLKLSEIAEVLEVTESRVSQIHSKCMILLKNKLEYYIKNLN